MAGNILVILAPGTPPSIQTQLEIYQRRADISGVTTRYVTNLTVNCGVRVGKTKIVADPGKRQEFFSRLLKAVAMYNVTTIVINDKLALQYVIEKEGSLSMFRGSVYFINGIPAIVIDDLRTAGGFSKLAAVPHAGWLLQEDLKKVKRYHDNTMRAAPSFRHTVCDTLESAEQLLADARRSIAMACDIETSGRGTRAVITSTGYTCLRPDGSMHSYAMPLVSPLADGGNFWSDDSLERILRIMRDVNASPCLKVLQNGMYDAHYYIRYRAPLVNYGLDTAVAFHSIWPEIPKRIDFISSVLLDQYRYWKDESKEDAKDDNNSGAVPQSAEGWAKYLRYNAMDCHFTLLSGLALLRVLATVDWVRANYCVSMRQFLGPGLAMSMRGVRCNTDLQSWFEHRNSLASDKARRELARMVRDNDFNPNSADNVAALVYDTFKATPLPQRGGRKPAKNASGHGKSGGPSVNRSTDEKVLDVIRTQHPLLSRVIKQIWDVKKPANNASKYGVFKRRESDGKWSGLPLFNGRWMYFLSPIGTETTRYASKASAFWTGTNMQNVPYEMRPMVEPDPGYILFDFDYSKADFWHTAFASGERNMMKVASDPTLDVHCYHAATFFKRSYDEIYKGYKEKAPWVVDSLHGVRQNAKRIVYGANYLMGGYTLFLTMGKDAVDAALDFLQIDRAGWGIKQYTAFCQQQLDIYFSQMYPGLMPWLEQAISFASRHGNRAVCSGGRTRTFFSNLTKDKAAQREFSAFFGQGGTAGMINRAMDNMYYSGFDSQEIHLLFQTHDSVTGQVREDCLHRLPELKEYMEVECEMNGYKFTVPAEGAVGYGWGYRMTDWHEGITIEEIKKADDKWKVKNQYLLQ